MDPKPDIPPVIVGSSTGAVCILQKDGSSATRLKGKWQAGIAFDHRDFLDMPVIHNEELRTTLLEQAAEALAKSLDR
jgi:hypothetical protein